MEDRHLCIGLHATTDYCDWLNLQILHVLFVVPANGAASRTDINCLCTSEKVANGCTGLPAGLTC